MFFPNQWDGFNRFKGLPKFSMPTPTPLNQVRSERRTDGFGSGNRCLCLPLSLGPADPVASQQVVSHPGGRVEISGRAWLLRPYSWTFTRCASLAVPGVNYSLAPPKFSHLYLLLTCASTTHLRLRTSHLCLRPAHLRLHFLLTYASLLSHLRLLYNLAFDWKCLLSFFPQCHDLKPGLLLKLHTPLPPTMPSSEI